VAYNFSAAYGLACSTAAYGGLGRRLRGLGDSSDTDLIHVVPGLPNVGHNPPGPVPDLPIRKLSTCLGPNDSGASKSEQKISSCLRIQKDHEDWLLGQCPVVRRALVVT